MSESPPELKIKLQIYRDDQVAMGPGKAMLLEAIEEAGSISGAARAVGMSYRRAWMLVDTMNHCWAEPLVETAPGGRARAGARVTATGREVLASYRALQKRAAGARSIKAWAKLQDLLL